MDHRDRLIDGLTLIIWFALLVIFLIVAGQRDRLAYVLAAAVGVATIPLSIAFLRFPSIKDEGISRRDRLLLASFFALWNGSLLTLMLRAEAGRWWRLWVVTATVLAGIVVTGFLRGRGDVYNPLGRLVRRIWERIDRKKGHP